MADDVVDFAERGNHDSVMIGELDRVDGFRIANKREVGNDRKDATGIVVRESFAENRGNTGGRWGFTQWVN